MPSKQHDYYYRKQEKILAKKKEKYHKDKLCIRELQQKLKEIEEQKSKILKGFQKVVANAVLHGSIFEKKELSKEEDLEIEQKPIGELLKEPQNKPHRTSKRESKKIQQLIVL